MYRTVYVCSPYRAESKEELKKNIEYAKKLTRKVLLNGDSPITPHLYMTNCLDDETPGERKLGLEAGKRLIEKCDFVLVGTKYGKSKGMLAEIKFAEKRGINVTEIYG